MPRHFIVSDELPNPFAQQAQRNAAAVRAQNSGIPFEIPACPDRELMANLINHGQPAHAAADVKKDRTGQCRLFALRFLFDCEDAAKGNKEAQQRVDALTYMWLQLRKEELIADDPLRVHGDIIDPRRLL